MLDYEIIEKKFGISSFLFLFFLRFVNSGNSPATEKINA
jgi:hypothetical protein